MQDASAPLPSDGHKTGAVIFVGHARLPQSIGLIDCSSVVSVEIEVDLATREVLHVDAKGVLPMAEALLRDLLQGGDLDGRVDTVIEQFQHRYVGPCQRAMCSAVTSAYDAYLRYCRKEAPLAEGHPT